MQSRKFSRIIFLSIGLLFCLAGMTTLTSPVTGVQASSLQQDPQEGGKLFQQLCQACHTIGKGKLVGPDLQGVTQRRDPAWLKAFITAPDKLLASGDPVATQLLAENGNVPMPNLGLSEAQVGSIIAYLENPAAGGQAAAAALPQGGSPAVGLSIFTGRQRLTNGGTPCIACHSAEGVGALKGGSLGPDLTHVFQRYGDAGLASALQTLPFPTMQGVFAMRGLTPEEVAHLYAYFQQADQQPAPGTAINSLVFWGIGALGALLLFALMLTAWPRQHYTPVERLRRQHQREIG